MEDFITVPITSWITLVAYSIWTIFLVVMVLIRRNHGPVKARSPMLTILSLLTMAFLVIATTLRFAIGRTIFPCFLYSMVYYLFPPGLFGPTSLRAWRLFVVYRMAAAKQVLADRQLKHRESFISSTNSDDSVFVDLKENENKEQQKEKKNQEEGGGADNDPIKHAEVDGGGGGGGATSEHDDIEMNDVSTTIEESEEVKMAETKSVTWSIPFEKEPSTSAQEGNVTTTSDELGRGPSRRRRFFTLSTWISTPFTLFLVVFVLLLHITVGLACNFYEPEVYFDFTKGCGLSTFVMAVSAIFAFFYLIIQFIMGILLLTVRDTWNMRYEVYFNIVHWFISVTIFVASSMIPFMWVVDTYFPYGNVVYLSCFLDSTVSCFIPLVTSYVHQLHSTRDNNSNNNAESGSTPLGELQAVLRTKKLRSMFRTFTVQSFAPESLLCWEYIARYKSIKSPKRRLRFGKEILDTFIASSGDMQINLPAGFKQAVWMAKLAEAESDPPLDFFDELRDHCEIDLMDMFRRYRYKKAYQKVKAKYGM